MNTQMLHSSEPPRPIGSCCAVDRALAAIQQTAQPRIKRTPAHRAFMPLRKNSV